MAEAMLINRSVHPILSAVLYKCFRIILTWFERVESAGSSLSTLCTYVLTVFTQVS